MQVLSFYLPNGHCRSLVIYEVDAFCGVICVALLINPLFLLCKTTAIEENVLFIDISGVYYLRMHPVL
jgi:hypothetical protein